MEPDKLKDLPVWFQIAAYAGMFFGTFLIALLGWSKKKFVDISEPSTKDAVVLSAAIADKVSMQQLAQAIETLCIVIRRNDSEDREDLERLRRDHRDLVDSMDRLVRAINARGLVL